MFLCSLKVIEAQSVRKPQNAEPSSSLEITTNLQPIKDVEAYSITVGEYLVFLKKNILKENSDEFYSDALKSQILWTSDHDDYEMAEGVHDDDLMLSLTPSDIISYFNWVENGSDNNVSPLMMFGGSAGDIIDGPGKKN